YPLDHSSSDHFSSDDSFLDSSLDSLSGYSSCTLSGHSIPDSPFDTSAAISTGPSHKRCRSSTTSAPIATPISGALSFVCDNLLPPRKSYKTYTELDIDFNVQEDINVGIATVDAAVARETNVRVEDEIKTEAEADEEANAEIQPEGTIEIRVDITTEIDNPDDSLMPDVVERLGQLEEEEELRQARKLHAHESQRL
nr:hypothetical protein [Tanacetum cinerariifolium]